MTAALGSCGEAAVAPVDATVEAREDAGSRVARDAAVDAVAPVDATTDEGVALDAPTPLDVPTEVDATEAPGPIELGTGRFAFEPLPRVGGRAELVMGPQGGWHIYGRVRLRGISPDVYLTFSLVPEDGGAPVNLANETVRRQERRGLIATGDFYETSAGELVILADGVRPPAVVGRRFRFGVRVERPDPVMTRALVGTDEREVMVVDEAP